MARRLAATTAALEATHRDLQDARADNQRQRDLLSQYEGVMATQARSLQVRFGISHAPVQLMVCVTEDIAFVRVKCGCAGQG